MEQAITIAGHFCPTGHSIASVRPYGSGNINDTYLVSLREGADADVAERFILQRINQQVFPYPERIMRNLRTLTTHLAKCPHPAESVQQDEHARWELPEIWPTDEGEDYLWDADGEFWRGLTFIAGARTYPQVQDRRHAREAGYALGLFQNQLSDLPVTELGDTLPGFHIMPRYLAHYDEVVATHEIPQTPEVRYGQTFISRHRGWANVLVEARDAGELSQRAIHGDPKIDNIMIADDTGEAVGIIDLDTVKPGLVQYDIGDCLRSTCNPLGEETQEVNAVRFELDLCEVILAGYLPQVRHFFTPQDYAYVYDSVRVLGFEMALRFFTDYLAGNVYFKTHYPENNLMRALVQFRLVDSIQAQHAAIEKLIAAYR